jgi:hypothetical protein
MIASSDKDYIETKLIKQGKKVIAPEFAVLVSRIEEIYGIRPINIYYDKIKIGPRANIIFEYENQSLSFREKNGFNYDSTKQATIADEFRKVVTGYDATKLFVCFSGFDKVARAESNWSVPSGQIEDLKKRLAAQKVWKIHRQFEGTVFFLQTDKEVLAAEKLGLRQKLSEEYFEILTKYDEFKYFKKDSFWVTLDSKENLDKNYEGDLFLYDR